MRQQVLPRIAVLIAAHNRRDKTVKALQALTRNACEFDLKIVVFDDGSTDGTSEALQAGWPDAIVLKGNGNAYWNGGMHAAWRQALTLDVDGYLWLNDDVRLDDDALTKLAKVWHQQGGAQMPFILVGATRDDNGQLSYGGQRRINSIFSLKFEKVPISRVDQAAETFNGNVVLISSSTVSKIGINDPCYRHGFGDFDYGLRASSASIPITVIGGTLGTCNCNIPVDLKSMHLLDRFRSILSTKGLPLRSWYNFTKRHSGALFPLHFILPYRKLFFPK